MNTNYTPGPWWAAHDSVTASVMPEDGGDIICEAPLAYEDSMNRWKANAQLIAAAPEMLDMLHECVGALISCAASAGVEEEDVEETVCESTNPARQAIVVARLAKYIIAKAIGEKEAGND